VNPQDPILPPGGAPPAEDAASQALAEALRSSFFIIKIIMAGLVLVFLGSGFFTVGPQEQAIVLRLGKPVGQGRQALLGPGPHWAWPAPIDEVIKLHITSLTNASATVGWYQTPEERARPGAPEPPAPPSLNPASSSYALSADTNIIHVFASAKYRITDPIHFLFDYSNAPAFITNALNNALLSVSSEMGVDAILTSNRAAFREQVQMRVQELTALENLGVTVDQVDFDSSPPLFLKGKFSEVDDAMIKRDGALKQAQTYATTNVNHAIGAAANRINLAESARTNMVAMIEAQANAFLTNRAQFESNPELFKRIKQMNALERVYAGVDDKIVVPPNSHELRFELNREIQAPTNKIPTTP